MQEMTSKAILSRPKNKNDRFPVEAVEVPGLLTQLYSENKEAFDHLEDILQRDLLLKKLLKPYCIGTKEEARLFWKDFLFNTFYRQAKDTEGRNPGEVQHLLQEDKLYKLWIQATEEN